MKKTTIYFIRHGDVYNPGNILYGRIPGFSLSKKGVSQIEELANTLSSKEVSTIYSSPMLRARQTAAILAKRYNLLPVISELLVEVKLIYEGIDIDLFRKKFQKHIYEEEYIGRGQESIKEIADRMIEFTKIVFRRHSEERVIAVSHGDPILILKAVTSKERFTYEHKIRSYIQPGEYVKLTFNNGRYCWQ